MLHETLFKVQFGNIEKWNFEGIFKEHQWTLNC